MQVFQHLSHERIKRLVNESTAVVIPSLYLDPYPTTCLEALSAGKAVFVSKYSGASEAIVNHVSGYVIDPADPYHSATIISDILSNGPKYNTLCNNARLHWEAQHSLESYASSLSAILSTL